VRAGRCSGASSGVVIPDGGEGLIGVPVAEAPKTFALRTSMPDVDVALAEPALAFSIAQQQPSPDVVGSPGFGSIVSSVQVGSNEADVSGESRRSGVCCA
jgi:hypothetical protein